MFTILQKKLLKDKLKNLKNTEIQKEIFNILTIDSNFKYTSNNNGVFFNINILNDETLDKISNILNEIKEIKNEKLVYKTYYIEKYNNDEYIDIKLKLKMCI